MIPERTTDSPLQSPFEYHPCSENRVDFKASVSSIEITVSFKVAQYDFSHCTLICSVNGFIDSALSPGIPFRIGLLLMKSFNLFLQMANLALLNPSKGCRPCVLKLSVLHSPFPCFENCHKDNGFQV